MLNFEIIIIENLDKKNYLNLVKNSSGFLFPSYREAFPLSLIESIFICKNIFIWENIFIIIFLNVVMKKAFEEFFINRKLKEIE